MVINQDHNSSDSLLSESTDSRGTSPAAPGSPAPDYEGISLAAVIQQAVWWTQRENGNHTSGSDLWRARILLQSWAIIKGLLAARTVDDLYERAPELREISLSSHGKSHGQCFWMGLERWSRLWATSGDTNHQGEPGKELLQTVDRLYKDSPLPPEVDPFNITFEPNNQSTSDYVSKLELVSDNQLQADDPGENTRSSGSQVHSMGEVAEEPPKDAGRATESYTQQFSIMYITNLQAMQAIQPFLETEEKESFGHIIARFRVWGCSLFTEPLGLDTVLQSSQKSIKGLRAHIIGILGDIALIAVRLLKHLAKIHDKFARNTVLRLQACFGLFQEVNSAVLEIPDSFYDSVREEEDITIASVLENQMSGLIACLWDVMPAISRVRKVFLLKLEQEQRRLVYVQDALPASTALGANKSTYAPVPKSTASSNPISYPSDETRRQRSGTEEKDSGWQTMPRLKRSPPDRPHDPMKEMLAMDLELAEAIKASLVSSTASEMAQSSEERTIMTQIIQWEKEISRLKDWSEAFDKSLSASPTPAETDARLAAFERLVNIGCVFASAIPKHMNQKSTLANLSSTEQKIKLMVAAMPKNHSMDVKIDQSGKSALDALNALSQTNKSLPTLWD